MTPAPCQCIQCGRYLVRNREVDNPYFHNQACVECEGVIPLAEIRGALVDPLSVELLGLLTEECGEVSQRVGKVMRWGWKADFEGTTQQHKLEVELGDVLAVMELLVHNKLIDEQRVADLALAKLAKFREDAAGPRQRLLVASVPPVEKSPEDAPSASRARCGAPYGHCSHPNWVACEDA